jgi:transcriptional regulator with XRE-family HTH domain
VIYVEFYKVLSEIMEQRKMSIPDVARACDLPDSTVRSILVRESQTVKLDVAFKLSEGLNVSLERLNGDPEPCGLVDELDSLDLEFLEMVKQLTEQEKRMMVAQMKALVQLRGQ